jgi:hypothetical protein
MPFAKYESKKSGKNPFAKFSYYELSDFMPSVISIFKDLKLYSEFSIENKELATLTIINADKPDDKIIFSSPVEKAEVKGCSPVQALGAVHTYLKRYLYMNALEIVESDMLDAQVGNNEKNKNSEMIERINQTGTLEQLNDMLSYFRKMEINDTTWKKILA